ncbi:MAG: type I glyceraldehyde-3-phosphate dehydrogenase [Holosporales bacterium]|jgi:glyceraldehyde 3-phosphate dehydrogenase|nr:type I glyceraldehyde-3-phosphate dehydrogenase [Holosporales bacterium]
MKIGINGFGRIGRMILRAFLESEKYSSLDVACINDLSDKKTCAYLLKYDSIHGRLNADVLETDDGISVNGRNIVMPSKAKPEEIRWGDYGIDVVFECSGVFTKKPDAERHINAGAKKVIISAPSDDADITVVYGINHIDLNASHTVISNASCTTNCLAPIAYILDREFGIESGFMTTIHAYTGDQRLIDTAHRDLRRARAGTLSIIPSTTGAARAVGLVLPNLRGKLDGTAIRVPVPNVSLVDLKCLLSKSISKGSINEIVRAEANGKLSGILGYNDEPLVSCDFNHSTLSSVFDATGTTVIGDRFCRVVAWYDNEFGFSNRMLDLAHYMATNGIV